MGYLRINNLYKDIKIMDFKSCYALEKIHGTSAHISWKDNKISYFSGGMKHDVFIAINDFLHLENYLLEEFGETELVIFGEAYGGKCQGMSETYGDEPKFIVFDVKIGTTWLNVPNAHDVAKKLNLEFVSYELIPVVLESINIERDKPSEQAKRNGCGVDKLREGVVLRPLNEYRDNKGDRVIVKHKREEFIETKTPREVDPEKIKILEGYKDIAEEWVTEMRLEHVLDKLTIEKTMENVRTVIKAMVEDVYREAKGEIVESVGAKRAISSRTALLFKKKISLIKED